MYLFELVYTLVKNLLLNIQRVIEIICPIIAIYY